MTPRVKKRTSYLDTSLDRKLTIPSFKHPGTDRQNIPESQAKLLNDLVVRVLIEYSFDLSIDFDDIIPVLFDESCVFQRLHFIIIEVEDHLESLGGIGVVFGG